MKKIKNLIIILVVILVVLCIAFAALYFATDTFKSKKKAFASFISKTDLSSFIGTSDLGEIVKRITEEPFSLDGNSTAKLELNEEIRGELSEELGTEFSLDEEFNYNIKNDPDKKYASAKIEFKQGDGKELAINLLRNEDLYGIQYVDIIKQYIVVKNENLKELAEKMGVPNTSTIPDKIDSTQLANIIKVNKAPDVEGIMEHVKPLEKKYFNLFLDQTSEKNYKKIKTEKIVVEGKEISANGYKLVLTGEELENIIMSLLQTAKEDEELYTLISGLSNDSVFDFEQYKETIENIDSSDLGVKDGLESLEISVYKKGNDLIRLYIKLESKQHTTGASNDELEYSMAAPSSDKLYIELFIDNNKTITFNYKQDSNYPKQATVSISKNSLSNDGTSYEIKMLTKEEDDEKVNANITLSKTGKASDQSIETSASIDLYINELGNIKMQTNNNLKFGLDEKIEEFTEGNYGILNEFTDEQIKNLSSFLQEQLKDKIDWNNTVIGATISITLNGGLFDQASEARDKTLDAMAKEAVTVAKAEILTDYYAEGTPVPDASVVATKIQSYLGADWKVTDDGSDTTTGIYNFDIENSSGKVVQDVKLDLSDIYEQGN